MADKRMISLKIVDSDEFMDLPLSSQCLYFHLNSRADDDGFINNSKTILRLIGASASDLEELVNRRFVLRFPSGVVVIKHWRMHNTLRKDRYHPTQYQQEYAQLAIKENGAYTERSNMATDTLATDTLATDTLATEKRKEEERKEEGRVVPDGNQMVAKSATAPRDLNLKTPRGNFGNVLLSDYEVQQLRKQRPADWEDKLQKVDTWLHQNPSRHIRDHFDTIIRWAEEDDKDARRNLSPAETSVHFALERHDRSSYDTHFVDLFEEG